MMSTPVSPLITCSRSEYSKLNPVFFLDTGVSDATSTVLPRVVLLEEDQLWLIDTVPIGLSNSWTRCVSLLCLVVVVFLDSLKLNLLGCL